MSSSRAKGLTALADILKFVLFYSQVLFETFLRISPLRTFPLELGMSSSKAKGFTAWADILVFVLFYSQVLFETFLRISPLRSFPLELDVIE